MAEIWSDLEIDVCVRTYMWMRDAEAKGYTPKKKRVREALIAGPMAKRSHGAIEYRFQNISSVLSDSGEAWIRGYRPAKNVGAGIAFQIRERISVYSGNSGARKIDCLVTALPESVVVKAVHKLQDGEAFPYPDPTNYELTGQQHQIGIGKVIGYASLLQYGAPLFPENFSVEIDCHCFQKIEKSGYGVCRKVGIETTDPESSAFRRQVAVSKTSALDRPPKGEISPVLRVVMSNRYVRDPRVVAYVENRAKGLCELCHEPAPFQRPDGTPFLEVHHILPLSEDGADTIDNAVALCPNCHRACHFGSETEQLRQRLCTQITAGSQI